jgi:hypothetical protein
MKKKTCICGCGRTFIETSHKRKYYGRSCYPASKRAAARKAAERKIKEKIPTEIKKKCICPCGKEFIDTTANKSRVFYSRNCKYAYLKANKSYSSQCDARRNSKKNSKEKLFRETVCRKKGNFSFTTLCANYSKCSDGEMTGKPWEYEVNGGKDCFTEPHEILRKQMGGSFANCQSRGFEG